MNIERCDTAILFDEERIALSWKSEDAGYRGQEVWDAAAPNFAKMPIPTGDDPFIRMLDDEVEFTPDMRVLDIGCGSGIYGLALASRVGEVVGIDISPKMIEAAREKACALDVRNVRFVQGDFRDMAFDEGFDLVFAHMTHGDRGCRGVPEDDIAGEAMVLFRAARPQNRRSPLRGAQALRPSGVPRSLRYGFPQRVLACMATGIYARNTSVSRRVEYRSAA